MNILMPPAFVIKKQNIVFSSILSILLIFPPQGAFAHESGSKSLLDLMPDVQPAAQFATELNTVSAEAAGASLNSGSDFYPGDFLGGENPLSPATQESESQAPIFQGHATENILAADTASAAVSFFPIQAALPAETSFIAKQSTGVYEMTLDNYFRSLLSDLMPASLTAGFTPDELVNVELAALRQRVQEGLAGMYDFVILLPTPQARSLLTNFNFLAPDGVQGFGAPEKDNILGIGMPQDDPTISLLNETFGPGFERLFSGFMGAVKEDGPLQGSAWIDLDAILDSGISTTAYKQFVILQELAHRWGTYLSSGGDLDDNPLGILGRDHSHWSAFFDAGTSPMDGMDWRDNGNGTFTLEKIWGIPMSSLIFGSYPQSNQFNDFDLYAMGLLGPSNTNGSFVIDNPNFSGAALTEDNFFDLFGDEDFFFNPVISGTRRNVGIQDIINIEGARTPSAAQAQKDFSVAFVTLKSGTETSTGISSHRSTVNTLASNMASLWSSATRSLSTMTLGPVAGAFESYRNLVLSLFDQVTTTIQTDYDSDLDTAMSLSEKNLAEITSFENEITVIENTIQPLLARASQEPAFNQALDIWCERLAQVKTSAASYKSSLQSKRSQVDALADFILTKRNNLLNLVNPSQSTGILPVGFGVSADASLEAVNEEYFRVLNEVKSVNFSYGGWTVGRALELSTIKEKVGPDISQPYGFTFINSDDAITARGLLTVSVPFDDSQLGPAYMRYSVTGGRTWSDFQNYFPIFQTTQWMPQGTHFNLLVQVCDFYWNCSSKEDYIRYDYQDSTPPAGALAINNGAASTNTGQLVLNLNFSDDKSQPAVMRYSLNRGASWSDYQTYAAQLSLEQWHVQGTNFGVLVQVCDYSWNCASTEDTILYDYQDSAAPTGTLTLNEGQAETSNGTLRLHLDFQDTISRPAFVRYSTSGGASWSAFQSYTPDLQVEAWPPEGTRFNVLVQVCDYSWNCSGTSDDILFRYQDSNPPTGSMQINGGAATASGGSMTLNLDFRDNETKLGLMRYSTNFGVSWSIWQDYAALWQISEISPQVRVQVCDIAWNCAVADDTIQTV